MKSEEATWNFVRQHIGDDVRQLALRGTKDPEVDLTMALQQIQGRQTARRKLPSWAACDGAVFPPHINMEQCSSEQTARYKQAIVRRLMDGGVSMYDLTGGFGVDFTLLAQLFSEATYVERDAGLCSIVEHNLPLLGVGSARVVCGEAASVLHSIGHATLIFLDPARRDSHGSRTYAISDCTPDVLAMRDELLHKADYVMLKLSPMLDWRKAVADLGEESVSEVHIVSVGGECKELLVVMEKEPKQPLCLYCTNDGMTYRANHSSLFTLHFSLRANMDSTPAPGLYLLEPNASVMKAGCWAEIASDFGIAQIAPNSHLFLSNAPAQGFPGRCLRIERVTTINKRDLRKALAGISRANITTRNFPLSVDELRRRLRLADGGGHYIFATTLADGTHTLIVCTS